LVIATVAHRRLGATSLAVISTLDRLLALSALPAALVEAATDDDPVTPAEALGDVLAEAVPGDTSKKEVASSHCWA
jgi:hypothetical protein